MASGAAQSRYYDIVVGNSTVGDTPADCDFLDIGDGQQLAAALAAAAAANPKKSVFVRRGTYDRGAAGSDGSALVVATSVLVVGDGPSCVIRVASNPNTHATKTLTVLDVSGEVRDLSVSVPLLTNAATTGTGVIKVEAAGVIRNIATTWTAGQTAARLGTTIASIDLAPNSLCVDCTVAFAPPFQADGVTRFASLNVDGTAATIGDLTRVERFGSSGDGTVGGNPGGGYGIQLASNIAGMSVQLFEPRCLDADLAGIAILSSSDTQITSPRCVWRDGNIGAVLRYGILATSGANKNVLGIMCIGGRFDPGGAGGGSVGIALLSTGAGGFTGNNEFSQCYASTFDEAVHVESSGGGTVSANGVVDSWLSASTVSINNVNDATFRSGGDW